VLRQLGMLGIHNYPSQILGTTVYPGMGMERAHNYTKRQARASNAHDRKGGCISRLIVLTKLRKIRHCTPLAGSAVVQSTALLSPGSCNILLCKNTGDTPRWLRMYRRGSRGTAGSSTNHALEAEPQAISQEVRDMAATDNTGDCC